MAPICTSDLARASSLRAHPIRPLVEIKNVTLRCHTKWDVNALQCPTNLAAVQLTSAFSRLRASFRRLGVLRYIIGASASSSAAPARLAEILLTLGSPSPQRCVLRRRQALSLSWLGQAKAYSEDRIQSCGHVTKQ